MRIRIVRSRRRPPLPNWALVAVAVWLALVSLLVVLMKACDTEFTVCWFHRITGLPCPTCGMTRGVLAILQGHLLAGWLCNPLMFTLLAIFMLDTLGRIILARRLDVALTRRQRRIAGIVLVAAVLVNWAYLIRYVG